ncbi:MAG: hypothetical protein PHX21_03150 [bacterium]|nr:hypothetical protein [bacterium]
MKNFLTLELARMFFSFSPVQILAGGMRAFIFIIGVCKNPMTKVYGNLLKHIFVNNGKVFAAAMLFVSLLSFDCKAESLGLKIPQMFCFTESFSNYKSSGNTFSIKNGEWGNRVLYSFEKTGTYTFESFGSLLGGAIGFVPSFLCAYGTLYALFDGGHQDKDIVIGTGLCVATSFIIPVGTAAGTSLTGSMMNQKGSFRKAYRGALIGGGIAWGLSATALTAFALRYCPNPGIAAPALGITYTLPIMGLGCIIGSVIGYNR